MAQFEPYLAFDGKCAEAMRHYERVLGGKIEMMMTYAEAPPEDGQPAAAKGSAAGERIMHASMTLDGARIMASDMPPGMPFAGMTGITVSLSYPSAEEGRGSSTRSPRAARCRCRTARRSGPRASAW